MSLRSLLLVVTLVATSLATASAQEGEGKPGEPRNSLRAGSWSIQFRVDENFQLTQFAGGVLSLKRHFSPKSALRVGIDFGLDASNVESDDRLTDDDTLRVTRGDELDSDSQGVELDVQYLYYHAPDRDVNLFLGGGPLFRYDRSNREDTRFTGLPATSQTQTVKDQVTSWALGVSGAVGVEWFFKKRLSLHAEYTATLAYFSSDRDLEQTTGTAQTRNELKSNGWDLGRGRVLFGLSAYF